MDTAVELLASYLRANPEPGDLIGNGLSGLLGLLVTRRYPELVRSLTLLSVGANPAATWHSQYYYHRQFFQCDRRVLLVQTAYHLFGYRDPDILDRLAGFTTE
jgi:pimeloyl-ACP methyl ester carboxylesterase